MTFRSPQKFAFINRKQNAKFSSGKSPLKISKELILYVSGGGEYAVKTREKVRLYFRKTKNS